MSPRSAGRDRKRDDEVDGPPPIAGLERLVARATWEDIVLPLQPLDLLHRVADQLDSRAQVYEAWGFGARMHRGLGITALFSGPSGTGKSMAAEVIANALRLDLYRIDLSAVVSKYIGETEQNLRRVFDAAEDGGALLFFDEADALFGKRSEAKDSHDHYANLEINDLLERMEQYPGIAILATNRRQALDSAFVRRLRFIVAFPFPTQADRRSIWEKVFPPEAPVEQLDFDRLSSLEVTGGTIRDIALHAAFRAAQVRSPITTDLLIEAGEIELAKWSLAEDPPSVSR